MVVYFFVSTHQRLYYFCSLIQNSKKTMRQFLKFTLASIIGTIIVIFLCIVLFVGSLLSLASLGKDDEFECKQQSILKLKLDSPIEDRASETPFSFSPGLGGFNFETTQNIGLNTIIKSIEKAGEDEHIEGIYLDLGIVMAGAAQIEEIREALNAFKDKGKFIIAYAETYDQKAYHLATVANEVYLHPQGGMFFKGIAARLTFYTKALEKLGVEMQVIRHGKFKAAVEPFMLDKMSDANREQTSALIYSVWNNMLDDISQSRNIPTDKLNQIADKLEADSPQKALQLKLVDGLKYEDEILQMLAEKTGKEEDEKVELVSIGKYTKTAFYKKEEGERSQKIALIYANGEIKNGKGNDNFIGEKNISEALIKASKDDKVKAIVLRVNSPGGSALVSDMIWREVVRAKAEKPVVVSMGNVAASGGYYISCAADYIFAEPNTITGSIGVFGLIPCIKDLSTEHLGLQFDGVNTNQNADYLSSLNQPLTPYQREVTQRGVERVYQTFIGRVAEGRNMTKEAVDAIGQGRVWAGEQALKIGLIDELGSLKQALAKAAELAEIEDYRIKELPKQKDMFIQMMETVMGQEEGGLGTYFAKQILGKQAYPYLNLMQQVKQKDIMQAALPYHIDIQ